MAEDPNKPPAEPSIPKGDIKLIDPGGTFGPFILAFFALQSSYDLYETLPTLFSVENPDFFGAVLDVFFVGYAIKSLADQFGIEEVTGDDAISDLTGLECCVTMSVGREPGTWMDKDWAASGARLSLPLNVRFSDEMVELAFPGEEALGGRYCKRLECESGRFVGPKGEVVVENTGGGWAAFPTGRPGESNVRFFIDFPEGAERNDVTLPAGRVFFSGASYNNETTLVDAEVLDGPRGIRLLKQGRLTIKKNTWKNFYGAFGDVSLILGRFTFREAKPSPVET